MENKNSNLSIIFKELIQCALLLAYIVSMNFMTKPLYLAIPAVLGIIIVKLSESSIRQQYKVLKIENDEEEEKACTFSALSELCVLLAIDSFAVGNGIGTLIGIIFFMINFSYSRKSHKYITEFLIEKYKEEENDKDK